jgi:hypothetical protein
VTTNGTWKLRLQHKATGSVAAIRMPQGGAVVTTSGVVTCTFTVAPSGPLDLAGTWVNGNPSTITVNNAPVPVQGSGPPPCLNGAGNGLVAFTYVVRDVSNAASGISVS